MRRNIDFKKYRREHYLAVALLVHCKGRITPQFKLVGLCPRADCRSGNHCTLKRIKDSPIAFCHCCHRAMDALEIVKTAMGTDYYTAAQELDYSDPHY